MSMLAEKRTKPKWILDPKQNDWTKDSSKFGQRMLEKMGWTPGKGLGASEQGITTALRIKYKCDNKGLGCKDTKFESLVQQKKFEMLLSELNSEGNNPNPEKKLSLEEKSKMTKKRVFYHKSIKGKDITRYSEKDLQCIFGFEKKSNLGDSLLADGQFQENIDKMKGKLNLENENTEISDRLIDSGGEEAEKFVEGDWVQNGAKKKKKKNKYFSEEQTDVKSKVTNKEKNKKSKKYLSDEIENGNEIKYGYQKFVPNEVQIQEHNESPVNIEINPQLKRNKKKSKRKDCTEDDITQNGDCEETENKLNVFKKKKKNNESL